jgi:threonine synthase
LPHILLKSPLNLVGAVQNPVKYISTRGACAPQSFADAVLTGLAPDGGLFVPENIPSFSADEIASWRGLSYEELAFQVMSPFVEGAGSVL